MAFSLSKEENEAAKEEVQDVLKALEELALNYDEKVHLAEQKTKELALTSEELIKKTVTFLSELFFFKTTDNL